MKGKIYISGPITGIDNYLDNFHDASKRLAKDGYIPIDPCTLPHEHDKSYVAYIKEDLKVLIDCDYIYMLNGWRESCGACFELDTAVICGIEVIYENK